MGKVIFCNQLRADFEWVDLADNEEGLLRKVADHAAKAHGIEELPEEMIVKVRSAMCNE